MERVERVEAHTVKRAVWNRYKRDKYFEYLRETIHFEKQKGSSVIIM